jgi:N-methylhydantoinase A
LFEDAYSRLYSRHIPGVEIEILSWVIAVGAPAEGELAVATQTNTMTPKPSTRRQVFDPASGEYLDVPIYWRPELKPGAYIAGPAVIAENDTSTVVGPLFDAQIDRFGYIELTRRET